MKKLLNTLVCFFSCNLRKAEVVMESVQYTKQYDILLYYKLDEVFLHNDVLLKVTERSNGCEGCFLFSEYCALYRCTKGMREDETNVKFTKV